MNNGRFVTHTHRRGWFKSSHSNSKGSCVETNLDEGSAKVRDSKDRSSHSPVIEFSPTAWKALTQHLTQD